ISNLGFKSLNEGDKVKYEIEQGAKGPNVLWQRVSFRFAMNHELNSTLSPSDCTVVSILGSGFKTLSPNGRVTFDIEDGAKGRIAINASTPWENEYRISPLKVKKGAKVIRGTRRFKGIKCLICGRNKEPRNKQGAHVPTQSHKNKTNPTTRKMTGNAAFVTIQMYNTERKSGSVTPDSGEEDVQRIDAIFITLTRLKRMNTCMIMIRAIDVIFLTVFLVCGVMIPFVSTETGKVNWFNESRGFGFLTVDSGGPDVFVHFSQIVGSDYKTLSKGHKVIFDIEDGAKGRIAVNVQRV
uniref:CSD domain-containing protein n=1 Tax=Strigamia maritima TaxID=126957 RepID=T1JBU1_STRMM